MAHMRKPLAAAATLNTAVFALEAAAGARSGSLSLLMDSAHNFSDELALLCLLGAYLLSVSVSRALQTSANALNSLGLVSVSAFIVWQAFERFLHPAPVIGSIAMSVGVLAAAGNWGVARVLRKWRDESPAIRLAYLHNLGDMYVSLVPVLAGVLVSVSGRSGFDSLAALGVGIWMIGSTGSELRRSGDDLLWPADVTCSHGDEAG
jgi:cobalt-zinc-cadmium efflux system protein